MSTFRNAVKKSDGKSAYIFIGNSIVKATIKINDDLVEAFLDDPIEGLDRLYIHIDHIIFADKSKKPA